MTSVLYIVMAGLLLAESLCSFGLGIALASRAGQTDSGGAGVIQWLGFLGLLGGLLLAASVTVAVPRMRETSRTQIAALISLFYGAWSLLQGAPPHLQYVLPDVAGGLGAGLCSLGFVTAGGVGLVIFLMERRNAPGISEVS